MQRAVLIPLIVACALFMENMDSTVITTSLPAIAADIGESPLALKLALTSYLVSLAVFIPISGWVADRYGSRTVFAAAIGVFMGGSLLCAASDSLHAFVIARFLQGIGGAMMVPVGRLVLMRAVEKRDYVAALNYLTIPALLGPVIGPALGGAITLYFHWRWIFLINIPIGISESSSCCGTSRTSAKPPSRNSTWQDSRCPASGLSLSMLGFSALGGHLLPMPITAACIVAGAAALFAYVRHAQRIEHPVIDLRLFRVPTFWHGVVPGSLFRIGLGATPFLLPLLFQIGFGLNPLQSGLLTCATAGRRDVHEDDDGLHPASLGLSHVLSVNGIAGVRDHRHLRTLHRHDAARDHYRRAAAVRVSALAPVHGAQCRHACRHRAAGHEPGDQHLQHGAAPVAEHRHRGGRLPAADLQRAAGSRGARDGRLLAGVRGDRADLRGRAAHSPAPVEGRGPGGIGPHEGLTRARAAVDSERHWRVNSAKMQWRTQGGVVMNPKSPQAAPTETGATPEQVSGETIREAATESVRAGVDIRARVHDVTLLALKGAAVRSAWRARGGGRGHRGHGAGRRAEPRRIAPGAIRSVPRVG
jgi:MFS family permease